MLAPQESKLILQAPQTTAFKESSLITKICHVCNPSNISTLNQSSLNLTQEHPPNLANLLPWVLSSFTLYHVPYSSDIRSAYRRVKVDPSCQPFQLLLLFDFNKTNWSDYQIVMQNGLPYGLTQSGTYLELALDEVADSVEHPMAKIIIQNFCIVDNLLY